MKLTHTRAPLIHAGMLPPVRTPMQSFVNELQLKSAKCQHLDAPGQRDKAYPIDDTCALYFSTWRPTLRSFRYSPCRLCNARESPQDTRQMSPHLSQSHPYLQLAKEFHATPQLVAHRDNQRRVQAYMRLARLLYYDTLSVVHLLPKYDNGRMPALDRYLLTSRARDC